MRLSPFLTPARPERSRRASCRRFCSYRCFRSAGLPAVAGLQPGISPLLRGRFYPCLTSVFFSTLSSRASLFLWRRGTCCSRLLPLLHLFLCFPYRRPVLSEVEGHPAGSVAVAFAPVAAAFRPANCVVRTPPARRGGHFFNVVIPSELTSLATRDLLSVWYLAAATSASPVL
jgi:hypothetical protein